MELEADSRLQLGFVANLNLLGDKLSSYSKDQSLPEFMFKNDFRTPLFFLQALSRIAIETSSSEKKLFQQFLEESKALEDLLGQIDFFQSLVDRSSKDNFPTEIRSYFRVKYKESLSNLEEKLTQLQFIPLKKNKSPWLVQWQNQLPRIDWGKSKKESKEIKKFLAKTVDEIKDDIRDKKYDFSELEEGVHELRRQVRWIPIYLHALKGKFKLISNQELFSDLQEYMIESVLKSPFNNIPVFDSETHPILISREYIYATSFLISELGKIKDKGQYIEALVEAYEDLGRNKAEIRTLLGSNYISISTIKAQVTAMVEKFFETHEIFGR